MNYHNAPSALEWELLAFAALWLAFHFVVGLPLAKRADRKKAQASEVKQRIALHALKDYWDNAR